MSRALREIEHEIEILTVQLETARTAAALRDLENELSEIYLKLIPFEASRDVNIQILIAKINSLSSAINIKQRTERLPNSVESVSAAGAGRAGPERLFTTSPPIVTIGLTGLADIHERAFRFVVNMIQKLINQLAKGDMIKIKAYEDPQVKSETLANINRVFSEIKFTEVRLDRAIEFSGYLTSDNYLDNDLILNFAGSEIDDKAILAHPGLYHGNLDPFASSEDRAFFLDHLTVKHTHKGYEVPSYVFYDNTTLKVQERPSPSLMPDAGPAGAGAAARPDIYQNFRTHFDEIERTIPDYLRLSGKRVKTMDDVLHLSALENSVIKVMPSPPVGEGQVSELSGDLPSLLLTKAEGGSDKQREISEIIDTEFPGKRQVRGDGNCYYRCIIYAYMEHILNLDEELKNRELDKFIAKLANLQGKFGRGYDRDLGALIGMMTQIIKGEISSNLNELMANETPPLDHLLVRAARAITAEHLVHAEEFFAFDEITGEKLDKEQYIQQTLSMKTDASGYLIESNALGEELGLSTKIKSVSPQGVVSDVPICDISADKPQINLLHDRSGRGGGDAHYFILYNPDQYRKLIEAEPESRRLRK